MAYFEKESFISMLESKAKMTIMPGVANGFYSAIKMLEALPSADVAEVKHGHWKDDEYGHCSVCDRSISEIYDADSYMAYGILDELIACPFCGARMVGVKNE